MEYRDLYDGNRNFTGEIIAKDAPIPIGRYYITVMVFIENSNGQFLQTRLHSVFEVGLTFHFVFVIFSSIECSNLAR